MISPRYTLKERTLRDARLLLVEPRRGNRALLERTLHAAGYHDPKGSADASEVVPLCTEFAPDLVLLELHLPRGGGFEVLAALRRELPESARPPVLALCADMSLETRAMEAGASAFLHKPVSSGKLLSVIERLLEGHLFQLFLQNQNHLLEELVRRRTHKLEEAQLEILSRLARAAELRDDDTGLHTQRVGQLAALLARELGLGEAQVTLLRRTAPLHDVGKIGIPDEILLKPGRLTAEEFEQMKVHTTIGSALLADGGMELLTMAERIALTHHERFDGSGYPCGLCGEEIPLSGRIVAVADVFDALTHKRPYKPAWSRTEALAEMTRQAEQQFDPQVVTALLSVSQVSQHSNRKSGLGGELNSGPRNDSNSDPNSDLTADRCHDLPLSSLE